MRLNRSRRGKVTVDVTTTEQDGNRRIRLTMGEDRPGKKNTDMDGVELAELITILQYHLAKLEGKVPWDG